MNKYIKFLISFIVGGSLYVCIEIMLRGYSHYSMFICGGLCFYFVGAVGKMVLEKSKRVDAAIILIMLSGALIITSLELITGIIVNIIFGMNVWDYSDMKYNVMGQICPVFSLMWSLISLPCVYIDSMIRKCIYREDICYIRNTENTDQT